MSILEQTASSLATKTTRRSALAKLGKVAFLTVGIGSVAQSFGAISPKVADATHECNSPTWCGLCGKPCSSCGGTYSTCPSSTYLGTYRWIRCCCFPDGYCWNVEYWDCCDATPGNECTDGDCGKPCNTGTWCSPSYPYYRCTVALFIGSSQC